MTAAVSRLGSRLLSGYFLLFALFLYAPLVVLVVFAFDDSQIQTLPYSGNSPSSQPVNWFWGVYRDNTPSAGFTVNMPGTPIENNDAIPPGANGRKFVRNRIADTLSFAVALLAPIFSAEVELANQLLPGLAHRHRVIARLSEQADPHRVGLRLHLPAIFEQRQDRAELGQLDQVAGINAGHTAGEARPHRQERENIGLAPDIAPFAKLLAQQI